MFKRLVAGVVVTVMLAGAAMAGPAEDAYAAYQGKDYAMALHIWKPLGEQGDASAQFYLGIMYAKGQGVPQDDVEAARWYRLAAVQGNVASQINLGVMYANGQGVPQDYAEAVTWYRKAAAEQGGAPAQFNLGVMYAKGQGVPEDDLLAHMWLNLAAEQGDETAAKIRDLIAKQMTPDQLAQAQRLEREWKPTTEP